MILVIAEHDRGELAPPTLEALTAARSLDEEVEVLLVGSDGDSMADILAAYGAELIHTIEAELLDDFGPELWGQAAAQAVEQLGPDLVLATGTDRGNEVMAQIAARLGLPFAANAITVTIGDPIELTRLRWGGSLVEKATLDSDPALITVAHHRFEPSEAAEPAGGELESLDVDLDPALARTKVRGRVEREAGVTLSTAPVVVGGGRGVGSADGFKPLEELAALVGGAVGCSRAVTNNGWRNHTDQVGQTGTRIAPEVYLACGISGAVQHWVGAMASKHIIAINTDPEANMVTKADYAVIGDLHQVVPAVVEEIKRRS